MENDKSVLCPLVDEKIEDIDCIENRDVAEGLISEKHMPERFTKKPDWKSICKKCEWHNY